MNVKFTGLLRVITILVAALTACAAQAERYALVVGIDNYFDKTYIPRLYGAENDADAAKKMLIDIFGFRAKNVEVLVARGDRKPTRHEIQEAVGRLIEKTKQDPNCDLAFFGYFGHGGLIDGATYLYPYDMVVSERDMIKSRALRATDLAKKLEGTRAKMIWTLFDLCRSTPAFFADRGGKPARTDRSPSTTMSRQISRDLQVIGTVDRRPSPKVKVLQLFAASPGQKSYESPGRKQGLLMMAMKSVAPKVSNRSKGLEWQIRELHKHLKTSLKGLAQQLNTPEQEPTLYADGRDVATGKEIGVSGSPGYRTLPEGSISRANIFQPAVTYEAKPGSVRDPFSRNATFSRRSGQEYVLRLMDSERRTAHGEIWGSSWSALEQKYREGLEASWQLLAVAAEFKGSPSGLPNHVRQTPSSPFAQTKGPEVMQSRSSLRAEALREALGNLDELKKALFSGAKALRDADRDDKDPANRSSLAAERRQIAIELLDCQREVYRLYMALRQRGGEKAQSDLKLLEDRLVHLLSKVEANLATAGDLQRGRNLIANAGDISEALWRKLGDSQAISCETLLQRIVEDETCFGYGLLQAAGVDMIELRNLAAKLPTNTAGSFEGFALEEELDGVRMRWRLDGNVQRAFAYAAERLNRRPLSTDGMLIGILRVENSPASRLLIQCGLRIDAAHAAFEQFEYRPSR